MRITVLGVRDIMLRRQLTDRPGNRARLCRDAEMETAGCIVRKILRPVRPGSRPDRGAVEATEGCIKPKMRHLVRAGSRDVGCGQTEGMDPLKLSLRAMAPDINGAVSANP
jgi:hypothetical protein